MRKASLFVALAAALVFAAAGSAITNGEPDGNAHPEVGALLATHAFSDGTWEECTGTLISSRVFLTAEHCDLGVDRVEVTFASIFARGTSPTYWGTWYGDPDYNKTASDPARPGVVVSGTTPSARGHHSGSPARPRARSRTCRTTSSSLRSATARSRSPAARAARRSTTRTSATGRSARSTRSPRPG